MASIDSQSQTPSMEKVQLKVVFDKDNNRVLWAEAGKDFVDVLFSFLTLPLGTIARLVSQKSNIEPVRVGSLSSLYKSLADLNEEYLCSLVCKEMLLWPRNSMEAYCNKLKLNIDDTPVVYFSCDNSFCRYKNINWCTHDNRKCSCGVLMKKKGCPAPERADEGTGFVRETFSYIICDDLHVIPYDFATSIHLLQKLGVSNNDAVEELIVDINKKKVIDLLKLSLLSKTPLTDLIRKKKKLRDYSNQRNQADFVIGKETSTEGREMSVKVTTRKSTGEILFAEGEEDFVDFILSFLAIPLGGVLHMLEASSSLGCFDNLYKSLVELSPERFLLSCLLKVKLVEPQCFPYFNLRVNLFNPKLSTANSSNFGQFVKGPSMYMVTNDLVVTPLTSISTLSHLSKLNVSISDLESRVIQIGRKEGLCLLKASLISTSSLTYALRQFISVVKQEK